MPCSTILKALFHPKICCGDPCVGRREKRTDKDNDSHGEDCLWMDTPKQLKRFRKGNTCGAQLAQLQRFGSKNNLKVPLFR